MLDNTSTDGWICTYTGRKFFPMDPQMEDICIKDIAHALSNMCRFTGHVRQFYSVADHSIRVAQCVYEHCVQDLKNTVTVCNFNGLAALLHDASEAYLCDLARPVKKFPDMLLYRAAERQLEYCIDRRFGVCRDDIDRSIIKHFDEVLPITEARDLMNAGATGASARRHCRSGSSRGTRTTPRKCF